MNIPPSLLASDDDAMSGFAYGDALWQDPGQLAIAQEHQSLSFFSPGFPEQQQQQQLQQQLPFYSQRPSISNSSASGSRSTPPPPPPPPAGRSSRQRHRNVRQGHTKSRNGCYNCKKRRIKCQESLPACGHCVKTGLNCEYPAAPQIRHQPSDQIPMFTMQDMRFFHHFLNYCYPHYPLKQEDVWTQEIPCLAHGYDYLMHAILGFAASELSSRDSSVIPAAMTHRAKAIRAIKKRLAQPARRPGVTDSAAVSAAHREANAVVATCFALTFQSVGLDDGQAEYMTFIRGIAVVGMQMSLRGGKPIFATLEQDKADDVLEPLMRDLPLIERSWVDAAHDAMMTLRPLCVDPIEIQYYDKLMDIVNMLYINSWDAYSAMTRVYGWWIALPHRCFQDLISPDNQVMMMLHSHSLAIVHIMAFITCQDRQVRAKSPESNDPATLDSPGFLRWLRYFNGRIDRHHRPYNEWPQWVADQLEMDPSFFGHIA